MSSQPNRKIKWGVLGNAKIAREKVVPGMQKCDYAEVVAVASRDIDRARADFEPLGVTNFYSSYEELLTDIDVEAVYIPLPNHMHVRWSIECANAGRHVLCEKPLALTADDVLPLIEARDRNKVKIGEAFMSKTHPQWLRVREIIQSGEIGELRAMMMGFSYFNRDAKNIRNIPEWGGGALMDIGCYPITLSRFLFGEEPLRVSGAVERDPDFGTDRFTSAILEYRTGQCLFTVSTQMAPHQRCQIIGTKGRIEVEVPVNTPPDRAVRILIDPAKSVFEDGSRIEEIPICDQYTIQGDRFSRAILDNTEVPVPLEDALGNMKVIESIFRSGASGRWEPVS